MKRAPPLAPRRWLLIGAIALTAAGGCLNPRPDDLPSGQSVSAGSGRDGASRGPTIPPAPSNGSPEDVPATETPASHEPAAVPADAGAAADAAARDPGDAAAGDAGPTEPELGVQ